MKFLLRKLGGTRGGVWAIKHLIAPLDRRLYRASNGRWLAGGRPFAPTLLLTTAGRKSGLPRTTPVFFLHDGAQLVICNVNPGFEHPNPWTLNIRAQPIVRVQVGSRESACVAREATANEIGRYWPQLVALWPAYQHHFDNKGRRSIFVLTPVTPTGTTQENQHDHATHQ